MVNINFIIKACVSEIGFIYNIIKKFIKTKIFGPMLFSFAHWELLIYIYNKTIQYERFSSYCIVCVYYIKTFQLRGV